MPTGVDVHLRAATAQALRHRVRIDVLGALDRELWNPHAQPSRLGAPLIIGTARDERRASRSRLARRSAWSQVAVAGGFEPPEVLSSRAFEWQPSLSDAVHRHFDQQRCEATATVEAARTGLN